MQPLNLIPVFDELDENGESYTTPYFIDSKLINNHDIAKVYGEDGAYITDVMYTNNILGIFPNCPYEDLNTGLVYDSLSYLCDKATDYRYYNY